MTTLSCIADFCRAHKEYKIKLASLDIHGIKVKAINLNMILYNHMVNWDFICGLPVVRRQQNIIFYQFGTEFLDHMEGDAISHFPNILQMFKIDLAGDLEIWMIVCFFVRNDVFWLQPAYLTSMDRKLYRVSSNYSTERRWQEF